MLNLSDQTNGLIAYIKARLAIAEAIEQRVIAEHRAEQRAAGTDGEDPTQWSWVQMDRQQRRALRALLAGIGSIEDRNVRQPLLMSLASMWLEHPPLMDRRGLPYTSNAGGLTYLTPCCEATPTYSMGVLSCRACYDGYDDELATTPDAAATDKVYREPDAEPPFGSGYCPKCKEWDRKPNLFPNCPTCAQPWAVLVTEAGVPA